MKHTILALLLIFSIPAFCKQPQVSDISADQIPAEAKIKGDVINAVTWKDKQGTHYVIETATKPLLTRSAKEAQQREETESIVSADGSVEKIQYLDADYRIKGLFTYHYLFSKNDGMQLVFKNIDFIDQCTEANLHADYLSKPIITDLDNDKQAEVWFLYAIGCRQYDATPLAMRMVLYQGSERAQVNGLQLVHRKDGKTNGGESRPDQQFKTLPQDFQNYGRQLWLQYHEQK